MILLMDIGNSRIKWATQVLDNLEFKAAVAYEVGLIDRALPSIFSSMEKPEAIYISSVAKAETDEVLTLWFKSIWDIEPLFMHSSAAWGDLTNAYGQPATLGVDRWCAMIAARNKVPNAAVMVIDAGTALTVDIIDAEGHHRGGFIVPGMNTLQKVLNLDVQSTASSDNPGAYPLLATNTKDAIHSGSLYMLASYIEHLYTDICVELKQAPVVMLTGGDSKALSNLLSIRVQEVPHLVLQGLKLASEAIETTSQEII